MSKPYIIEQQIFEDSGNGAIADSNFFSKVISAFGLAIAVSALGTYAGFYFLGEIFFTYSYLMWVFIAVELILVFTARSWSTKHPINYLLFALFAFITGITIVPLLASVILEFGGPAIIIKALLATTLVFASAGIYGWVTHRNLSGLRGFLTIALIGMIILSLIHIFVPWSSTFELIFSGFGVILFTGYAMHDIQNLKHFPNDRYIDAALMLYLDMFNLFIFILRLMSGSSRN